MHLKTATALLCAAQFAGCSRTEPPAPTAQPAPSTASTSPAPSAPASTPVAAAPDFAALSAQAWRVTESPSVAAGSLYVFLPDHTLLVATPGSPLAKGEWRSDAGRLTMVEESRPYPTDVLELQGSRLRLRSHNPGTPVEMTLAAVEAAAEAVPQRFRGEWNARRADCGKAGTEARLELSADAVRFHESAGKVLAVVPHPAGQLDLVARVQGEGSTRLAWRRYRLAQDGASLADITEGSQGGLVRVRCP